MKLTFEEYAKMTFGERYTNVQDRLDDLAEQIRDAEGQLSEEREAKIWRAFADLEEAVKDYKELLKEETREYLSLRRNLDMISKSYYGMEEDLKELRRKWEKKKSE